MHSKNKEFCKVCGREISKPSDSDSVVELRVGSLAANPDESRKRPGRPRKNLGSFRPSSVWGYMHKNCFAKSVGSPDDMFNLIKVPNGK